MREMWLSAGRFARKSMLSAKALRIYAESGLLVPDHIDPANGYRQDGTDQLRDARLVRLLRRGGMPLASVASVMGTPRRERATVVAAYLAEVEREYRFRSELLTHLIRTLDGGTEHYPMIEVKLREVEDQTVLTEQAHVTAATLRDWIVAAGRQAGLRVQPAAASAPRRPALPKRLLVTEHAKTNSIRPQT